MGHQEYGLHLSEEGKLKKQQPMNPRFFHLSKNSGHEFKKDGGEVLEMSAFQTLLSIPTIGGSG